MEDISDIATPVVKTAEDISDLATPVAQVQPSFLDKIKQSFGQTGTAIGNAATNAYNTAKQSTQDISNEPNGAIAAAKTFTGAANTLASGLNVPFTAITSNLPDVIKQPFSNAIHAVGSAVGSIPIQGVPLSQVYQNLSPADQRYAAGVGNLMSFAGGSQIPMSTPMGVIRGTGEGVIRGTGEAINNVGESVSDLGKHFYGKDLGITKSVGQKAGQNVLEGKQNILSTIQQNDLGSMSFAKSYDKTADLISQKNNQYHEILRGLSQGPDAPTVVPEDVITLSNDDIKKNFRAGERRNAIKVMNKILGEIDGVDQPSTLDALDAIKAEIKPVYNKGAQLSEAGALANKVRMGMTFKLLDNLETYNPQLRQLGRDQKDLYNVQNAYEDVLQKNINKHSLWGMSPLEILYGVAGGIGGVTATALHNPYGLFAAAPIAVAELGKGGRAASAFMGTGKKISELGNWLNPEQYGKQQLNVDNVDWQRLDEILVGNRRVCVSLPQGTEYVPENAQNQMLKETLEQYPAEEGVRIAKNLGINLLNISPDGYLFNDPKSGQSFEVKDYQSAQKGLQNALQNAQTLANLKTTHPVNGLVNVFGTSSPEEIEFEKEALSHREKLQTNFIRSKHENSDEPTFGALTNPEGQQLADDYNANNPVPKSEQILFRGVQEVAQGEQPQYVFHDYKSNNTFFATNATEIKEALKRARTDQESRARTDQESKTKSKLPKWLSDLSDLFGEK